MGMDEDSDRGDHWWACPLIEKLDVQPDPQPTFREIMDHLRGESDFATIYYNVASSKAHGAKIWNPPMVLSIARALRFVTFLRGTQSS